MQKAVINPLEPLKLDVRKYAQNSQTERLLSNFVRQQLASARSLEEMEVAILAEYERLKGRNNRPTRHIETHTFDYVELRNGKTFRALTLHARTRKGFLTIKENYIYRAETNE